MTGNPHTATKIPDEVLVQNFLEGSDIAYVNLYNRYKQPVFIFCLKMLSQPDAAADIVQGVFLKVYERRVQLEHTERFRSWLFAIARNDCLSYIRREGFTARIEGEYKDDASPLPSRQTEMAEEAEHLGRAVSALSPEHREVILLREYEDMSYREIADILMVSESIVKSRLFAARRQLYLSLRPIFEEGKEP